MPGRAHALEPAVGIRRLALRLDRQVDGGLHRERALAEHGGTAVCGVRRARRHHHVLDAVEQHGGARHLGELIRRLVRDGAAGGQRLANRAELAGLGAALVADAGLQHGRRQHVLRVQHGDLRIGDAVKGLQAIEARLARERHAPDIDAVALDGAETVGVGATRLVGRLGRGGGVDRHHHGATCDRHCLVVRRTRAAAPALRAHLAIGEADAEGLQLVDQLLGGKVAHAFPLTRLRRRQADEAPAA